MNTYIAKIIIRGLMGYYHEDELKLKAETDEDAVRMFRELVAGRNANSQYRTTLGKVYRLVDYAAWKE